MSQTEVQAEFADALHRAGLRPKGTPVMDGKKHRVPVEGDRRGRLSGTYIGHLDGHPAGYIHNFKTGEEIRWRASRPHREMTPEERARERQRVEAERAARDGERQHRERVAAHQAQALWDRAKPAAAGHPYLARKDVGAHGLRQDRRGNLLVPMRDADGALWGVQTIAPDGTKLFMRGGRQQGTFATLGQPRPGEPVIIAEGFATAATMREVTGLVVAVAFNSGNLGDVARAMRERDPAIPIIVAGDNDHHLPRRDMPLPNVGAEKAAAAAQAVRGIILLPSFSPSDPGTDWNDYAGQHGKSAVRTVVERELHGHGIGLPKPMVTPVMTQASRDAARQAMAGHKRPARKQTSNEAMASQEAARRNWRAGAQKM